MTAKDQLRFWLIGLAVTLLALWLLRGILLPFVAAMAVAYFLDPAADRLERWGCSRLVATSIIMGAFFALVLVLAVLLVPLLQKQAVDLATHLPDYFEAIRTYISGALTRIQARLPAAEVEHLRQAISGYSGEMIAWIGSVLAGIWSGGLALVNVVSLIFVTPVVCFYLLRDWDRMVARIDSWLPQQYAPVIREQARLIDETLAAFVHGQALVCIILGTYYAAGLSIAGLDFGLIIGVVAGLISFIPYVGSVLALVSSIGIAFAQTGGWQFPAICAGVVLVGQVVEGNYLQPVLIGDRVKLHAVWVIFALLAGGSLLGFVGILLAVPVAAVIGVLGRFALQRYLESPLYRGAGSSDGSGDGE